MKRVKSKEVMDRILFFLPLSRNLLHEGEFTNKHGIMPSHMRVLLLLHSYSAMSTTQIGRILDISKPNVTPIIDKLIALNFVKRETNTEDRRIINISITASGREYLEEMQQKLYKKAQILFSVLSDNELSELNEHMRKANQILEKLSPKKIIF